MKRMNKTKTILALALVALLLTCAVGGTVAYLVTQTNDVTNTFTPGKVTCAVEEDFTQGASKKSNVKIWNTGTTDAWIRATVVGNWVKDGKIVAPWTDDIEYNTADWIKDGNYYYYKSKVVANGKTNNLFTDYSASVKADGAHLELTIVCQAVQSNLGETAKDAFENARKQPTATGD